MAFIIKNKTGKTTKKQTVTLVYSNGISETKQQLMAQEETVLNIPIIPASIKKLEMVGLISISFINNNHVIQDNKNKANIESKKTESLAKETPTQKQKVLTEEEKPKQKPNLKKTESKEEYSEN